MRKNKETPTIDFDYTMMKPGADFYTGNFFSLLLLFFYVLFFFNFMIESTTTNELGQTLDLNTFSLT